MDTIKKLSALLLILCMALGLTACSADSEDIAALGQVLSAAAEALDSAAQQSEPPAQAAPSAASPAETKASDPAPEPAEEPDKAGAETPALDRDGEYTSRDDVALYLHLYGELPKNFISKNEARDLGWSGGGLDDYAYGMCIGGDRFGNYEGVLPDGSYHECDIDTLHARSRGAKRLVYADDGRIYYTDDHYESFTLLYGEE